MSKNGSRNSKIKTLMYKKVWKALVFFELLTKSVK